MLPSLTKTIALLWFSLCCMKNTVAQRQPVLDTAHVRNTLSGHIGNAINKCITNRLLAEQPGYLVAPFRKRTETSMWQSEFWGKWMLSMTAAYRYAPSPALKQKMEEAVKGLLDTQTPDGYIGNYADTAHLKQWDIWGRKYSMLGLIHYYNITKDNNALDAASRVADHLLTETGPGKINIVTTGNYRGMASSSILEPMVLLYKATGDKKYLDFANYIVAQWETTAGPQLISKALQKIPVAERFRSNNWWSWENGQKAYEMMSCYDGLLDLYLITQQPEQLEAVKAVAEHIMTREINIAGSGSAYECWYHGNAMQTQAAYHTMETCVTQTWMKLCFNLYRVTGDPIYADEIERSAYNALLCALTPDGASFAQYSPLEGYRYTGELQCNMNTSCCIANGPRGLLMLPSFAALTGKENTLYVNLYTNSYYTAKLANDKQVSIQQLTNYPVSDSIVLMVDADTDMTLALRIPSWSAVSSIRLNGQSMPSPVAGKYALIERRWKKGDRLCLKLDLEGRVVYNANYVAIMRGPVVLARDSRLEKGFPDDVALPMEKNGRIPLTPLTHDANRWMAFSAPFVRGIDLKNAGGVVQLPLTDFSSAGNDWDNRSRFRVWIPLPLDVKQIGAGKLKQ